MKDLAQLQERSVIATATPGHDAVRWHAKWRIEKFDGDWNGEQIAAGLAGQPYEVIEREGNLLMYGGASCLWQCLIGNGTGTAAQTLTFFNNGNAHIGVGDSNTAAAATQTDLQASTNKLRKAMEATYPQHTDGVTSGAAAITFRSVFGSSEANWAWEEWGVFNGSSGGRMLNRKVEGNGTKASGSTWTFTVTLSLS
ncbi:MAG: hypothetical protein H6658_02015 [Ardenticatenaceae bacterium]|nr:hypothetical protein [Ardenticatenaceae bacterium]